LGCCTSNIVLSTHLEGTASAPHLAGSRWGLLRATGGVGNGTSEAKEGVEEVGSALVTGTGSLDLSLSILALSNGSVVGLAEVVEVVAEGVGDDVGVQGLALSATGNLVGDLEGELVGGTVALASLEGDGGCAETEVSTSSGTSTSSGLLVISSSVFLVVSGGIVLVVVVLVLVLVVVVVGVLVVVLVVVLDVISGLVFAIFSVVGYLVVLSIIGNIVSSIISSVVGGLVVVVVVLVVVGIASTGTSSSGAISSLSGDQATETSLVEEVEDGETVSVQGVGQGLSAESVDLAIDVNIGVDQGSDTTELSVGRERRVAANVLNVAIGKGVGVLLSSNQTKGCLESIGTSTKSLEDLIGTSELESGSVIDLSYSDLEYSLPWRKRWLHREGQRWLHQQW
jgi:hypothetical protein